MLATSLRLNEAIPNLYWVRQGLLQLTGRGGKPTRLDQLKTTIRGIEAFIERAPEQERWVEEHWPTFTHEIRSSLVAWAADDPGMHHENPGNDATLLERITVACWMFVNRRYVRGVIDRGEYALCSIADEIYHQDEVASRSSDLLMLERLEESQRLFPVDDSMKYAAEADVGEPVGR